jgi:ABC-2 type transport system ATP-binding protein
MLSTHIMQEVQAVCERVIIIHQGKIVADDSIGHLQSLTGDTVLTIEFDQAVDPAWLRQLVEVKEIHQNSPHKWALTTAFPDKVKKSLWQQALQNNLNIVSLHSNTSMLEDVFRKLTGES